MGGVGTHHFKSLLQLSLGQFTVVVNVEGLEVCHEVIAAAIGAEGIEMGVCTEVVCCLMRVEGIENNNNWQKHHEVAKGTYDSSMSIKHKVN